ncbi:MAG: formylglycine-generating enzyme family protein [Bacteroidetes bacterium]|nr:formylglycine-generating enzyme family protein [Bacteroidota bacterium]
MGPLQPSVGSHLGEPVHPQAPVDSILRSVCERVALALLFFSSVALGQNHLPSQPLSSNKMIYIRGGSYIPFSKENGTKTKVVVNSFYLDASPVTNGEFLKFVKANQEWRRSRVKPIFADKNYLRASLKTNLFHRGDAKTLRKNYKKDTLRLRAFAVKNILGFFEIPLRNWTGDLTLGNNANPSSPVIYVSWFAARAYCKWTDKQLPTIDEWEYAARQTFKHGTDEDMLNRETKDWDRRKPERSAAGIYLPVNKKDELRNSLGKVWEWVEDFNSVLLDDNSKGTGTSSSILSCGGASVDFTDPSNYSAFLRYAFRSTLKADYCLPNLGFRCAKSVNENVEVKR